MFKNVASQKIALFAFDYTTGAPKTGDAANLTFYVNKDWGGVNALADTSASELSSTNAPGWYVCDVSQAESNADVLHFTGKSSTANVVVVGQLIQTVPASFTSFTSPLDAAAVRTAVGLASANLDTQIGTLATSSAVATLATYVDTEVGAIKTKTDLIPAAPAAVSDIPSASTIAAAVWAYVIESTTTAVQYMRGFAAVLLGKASGLGTTTAVYRDPPDTKARVTATVDADGNRSAVTRDLT